MIVTEDLIPHHISILFLIDLYLNDQIPKQGEFLRFLTSQLTGDVLTLDNEILILPTLSDLCSYIGTAQDKLLPLLWLIKEVSDLESKFTDLYNRIVGPSVVYTEKGKVSSRSIMGMFIYKVVTSFRLLKFEEVFILFTLFLQYRGGVEHEQDDALFMKLNKQLEDVWDLDSKSHTAPHSSTSNCTGPPSDNPILISNNSLKLLLAKQISIIESFGTPVPTHLKAIMKQMASANNIPSYYYIQYLENLHTSNYIGAFQSLHKYFDYMVLNNSKYFYHFALISKASLHQFFGEDEKAIDLIEEAISVARENKDNATLTFILSWLFNFMRNKPDLWHLQSFGTTNTEDQLLDFLIQKSQLVSLSLYLSSYNFKTLQLINSGGLEYFETLLKATFISLHDNNVSSFVKSAELQLVVWNGMGVVVLSDIYHDIAVELADKEMDKFLIKLRHTKDLPSLKDSVILQNNHSLFGSFQVISTINEIKQNMKSSQFNVSSQLIDNLLNTDIRELDLKNEVIYLHVENEISLKNYSYATKLIEKYLVGVNLKMQTLRLKLLKCKIYRETGNHNKGLVKLVKIIETAKTMKYSRILLEGILILVGLLGKTIWVENLIRDVIPSVLSLQDNELIKGFYDVLGYKRLEQSEAVDNHWISEHNDMSPLLTQ